MNIQTLIDKAGGVPQLAALLGCGRTTVLDWKRSGYIPGNRVLQISAALDIPAVDLIPMLAPTKPQRRAGLLAFA